MNSGADVDRDLGMTGFGVFLALEGLEVTLAELVGVVDDPGLAGFAAIGGPVALADGRTLLRWY
jgi:hypothetical protein